MKRIVGFLSNRCYTEAQSYKIVYEWEDIISERLKLRVIKESWLKGVLFYGLINRLHCGWLQKIMPTGNKYYLWFTTMAPGASLKIDSRINKNRIPIIIDFWLKRSEFPSFYKIYRESPLILITSREVFEALKEDHCPLPIEHWPLSFPDFYAIEKKHIPKNKKYELCLFGRNNPFFIRMLDKYCERHSDFSYIRGEGTTNNRSFYNNKGEFLCKDAGRETYLDMIKHTKISCYSTPGIDETKSNTNGYNQVTPRVFEMLSNGCQVIGHYPFSADVKWYQLNEVVPNVTTYDEFEKCLDEMRLTDMNQEKISSYMSKHYTSNRVPLLVKLLAKHNFEI